MKRTVTINYPIKARFWKDKATNCWIYHNNIFAIYAYGSTQKKAKEMFHECVKSILTFPKK
jgi:hypothetical protein